MEIENFDWGNSDNQFRKNITFEIFEKNIYERFFEVEPDDVVLDIGASVGPFTYSILPKKPKHVFCFEPSVDEFYTLEKNTKIGPVTCINKAVTKIDGSSENVNVFNSQSTTCPSTTFQKIISDYNLKTIDFMKIDCEGGEYDIFNEDNMPWICDNVRKIAGEWHLGTQSLKENFRGFRDEFLVKFKKYEVLSVDLCDIKWDLWNEHFLEYYTEVLIFIDNR